jgi:hypothetical protein
MGQVHTRVLFTNYREVILARLGQFDVSQTHRYETEALIDTGATRCTLPVDWFRSWAGEENGNRGYSS